MVVHTATLEQVGGPVNRGKLRSSSSLGSEERKLKECCV